MLDTMAAERAAYLHLYIAHGGPTTRCEDRTPVEQVAHERKLGLCKCELQEIYGNVPGWEDPNV